MRPPDPTRRTWPRCDMSGSAPGLFICRGCRLHVMLRPTRLLPEVQLALPRLSTPRWSVKVSLARMGLLPGAPALTGAGLAPAGRAQREASASPEGQAWPRFVTAHHGSMLPCLIPSRGPGNGLGRVFRALRMISVYPRVTLRMTETRDSRPRATASPRHRPTSVGRVAGRPPRGTRLERRAGHERHSGDPHQRPRCRRSGRSPRREWSAPRACRGAS
jgi:hypothetical protein